MVVAVIVVFPFILNNLKDNIGSYSYRVMIITIKIYTIKTKMLWLNIGISGAMVTLLSLFSKYLSFEKG